MFESLAHLAERRAKLVLACTVAFTAVAGILGGSVATRLVAGGSPVEDPGAESKSARDRLTHASGANPDVSVLAIVRTGEPVNSSRTRAKVAEVARKIAADPAVARIETYYSTRRASMVSIDKRATDVLGYLKPVSTREQVDAGKRFLDDFKDDPQVALGGVDVGSQQINDQVQEDLGRAEMFAFPILFILALVVFRGVVAALLPIFAGMIAILGAFLGLRIVNEVVPLSIYALNLVIAIGLGLAIDYSLFIVSRYREELTRVGPGAEALRRTLATAGRTVAFSAATVAAALASLMIFPQSFLYSMGAGGILVAFISASVALIALPAALALLGPRIDALAPKRWREATQRTARAEASGFWYRLSRAVMRRSVLVAVASATLMIVLGLPFLGIKFTGVDPTILPKSASAHEAFTIVNTKFPPNQTSPLYIAVHAPQSARMEVERYAARLRERPGAAAVTPPQYVGGGYWRVDAISKTTYLDDRSQNLVRDIRNTDSAFSVYVGGDAASFLDTQDSLASHLPYALAVLALTTLVLLFFMTGSVILPFKTLLMNFLTVSAVFGLLVWIFQDGRLESVIRYVSQGALNSTQPLLIGATVFALSTDYGVFLLTRIKEAHDAGASNEEAVARGVERTGRIVTAAALLFCVAIGAFATSKIVFIKEIGVGVALGVIIDATIVRGLLVPSLMKLLGEWNWWAPRRLRRVYDRFGLTES
jgi:uncharacterized membrane protein YdfJ with MMPL/SSD domain